MGEMTLVIDPERIPSGALVRWAKRRIAVDGRELADQLRAAGLLAGNFDIGLHFDAGLVMVRDRETGTVYVPGPITTLIGQTLEGREILWRDGEEVYNLVNPA